MGTKLHLGGLGVRSQKQEGEIIRAEGRQQQRWRPLEECLLTGQVVNVLHSAHMNGNRADCNNKMVVQLGNNKSLV